MASSSYTITKTSTLILLCLAIFLIFLTKPNVGQLLPSLPIGVNINTIVVNGTLTCSPNLVTPGRPPLANTRVTISSNGNPLASNITDENGNFSVNIPINGLLLNLVGGGFLNGLTASVTAPIAGCDLFDSVTPGTVLPLPLIPRSFSNGVLNLGIGGLV
ncbi:unnamed protein product [Amaranthus hypochondriacus]